MLIVNELAKRARVSPDTVRHYVQIGLLNPTRNPDNGYKLFSLEDVNRVRFIRQAKSLGFTLKEIAEILEHSKQGKSPCPRVREIMQARVVENRRRLNDLYSLQSRMELAIKQWEKLPDGVPDGDSICHLIETTGSFE